MSEDRKRVEPVGDSESEGVRRKYLYRKLVMNRGVKVPARLAMKLVGPDCAYHLYSQHSPGKMEREQNTQ